MKYDQVILPHDGDGSLQDGRAPAMWHNQAYGFNEREYIEYVITGTDTGMSKESGELLTKYFVRKCVEYRGGKHLWDIYSQHYSNLTLYVNEKGEAYRSWKGKLKGRPVCNFETGDVYKYIRPKKKEVLE